MKYYLLIFAFLLATSSIYSQPSADTTEKRTPFEFPVVKDKVDDFENSSEILISRLENWALTKIKPDGNGRGIDIAVGSSDGLFYLNYYGTDTCFKQGETKISLLLENDDVVDLGYFGDVDCKSTVRKAKFLFVGPETLEKSRNKKELKKYQESAIRSLLSSPVNKIRVYSTEGYTNYETYSVEKSIENTRRWYKNSVEEAESDFEKSYSKKQYAEYIDKYNKGDVGIIYYKIPYDYYIPLNSESMASQIRLYLQQNLNSYDENVALRSYYDFYKGNTKFALMDMLTLLKSEN